MTEIISKAPGRICLFGDHQDYLGLPVIACAIDRHITLTAKPNETLFFNIKMPDVNTSRIIDINSDLNTIKKGDYLMVAIKVLKSYDCIPNIGYDIICSGNIPINSGLSSSSALIIAWIYFLIEAFGKNHLKKPEIISRIAYEVEVLEQGDPGGKMDQYSIGLGHIMYLETGQKTVYELIQNKPTASLIIGDSGVPKKTLDLLSELKSKSWEGINIIKNTFKHFNLNTVTLENHKPYLNVLPKELQHYFLAAIKNHDITRKALSILKSKEIDYNIIGDLMSAHHEVLKNMLKITVPAIDKMIDFANNAGALGSKIVGSGGGGCIVAITEKGDEKAVINAIKKAGAKDAFQVSIDSGARAISKTIEETGAN